MVEVNTHFFEVIMVWKKQSNHITSFYFCLTNVQSLTNRKSKRHILYSNLPSAIRSIPHSETLLVPTIQTNEDNKTDITKGVSEELTSHEKK